MIIFPNIKTSKKRSYRQLYFLNSVDFTKDNPPKFINKDIKLNKYKNFGYKNVEINEYYIAILSEDCRNIKIIYKKNIENYINKNNIDEKNLLNEIYTKLNTENAEIEKNQNIDFYKFCTFNEYLNKKVIKIRIEESVLKIVLHKLQIFFMTENSVYSYTPFSNGCLKIDLPDNNFIEKNIKIEEKEEKEIYNIRKMSYNRISKKKKPYNRKITDICVDSYLYILSFNKIYIYYKKIIKTIDLSEICHKIAVFNNFIFLYTKAFYFIKIRINDLKLEFNNDEKKIFFENEEFKVKLDSEINNDISQNINKKKIDKDDDSFTNNNNINIKNIGRDDNDVDYTIEFYKCISTSICNSLNINEIYIYINTAFTIVRFNIFTNEYIIFELPRFIKYKVSFTEKNVIVNNFSAGIYIFDKDFFNLENKFFISKTFNLLLYCIYGFKNEIFLLGDKVIVINDINLKECDKNKRNIINADLIKNYSELNNDKSLLMIKNNTNFYKKIFDFFIEEKFFTKFYKEIDLDQLLENRLKNIDKVPINIEKIEYNESYFEKNINKKTKSNYNDFFNNFFIKKNLNNEIKKEKFIEFIKIILEEEIFTNFYNNDNFFKTKYAFTLKPIEKLPYTNFFNINYFEFYKEVYENIVKSKINEEKEINSEVYEKVKEDENKEIIKEIIKEIKEEEIKKIEKKKVEAIKNKKKRGGF